MYNTIIFDLDGTLLNTIEDLATAVNFIQSKNGWPMHNVDEVRSHVGNGIRNLVAKSIPDGENNPLFEKAFADYKEYYREHSRERTCAYPGIMDMLQALKDKGYKMAIVSNKANSATVDLHEIYFKEYIQIALGESEAAGIKKKPAADMVNLALEKLESSKSETIYVGDSEVDKATSDNSGLECVLCAWGFRDRELLEELKPKALINHPMELLNIVQN